MVSHGIKAVGTDFVQPQYHDLATGCPRSNPGEPQSKPGRCRLVKASPSQTWFWLHYVCTSFFFKFFTWLWVHRFRLKSLHGSGFTIFVPGFDCDSGELRCSKKQKTTCWARAREPRGLHAQGRPGDRLAAGASAGNAGFLRTGPGSPFFDPFREGVKKINWGGSRKSRGVRKIVFFWGGSRK